MCVGTSALAAELDIHIGGRAVQTGDRNYITMFGDAGSNSTTGTITDIIDGETFTATFTLSVSSTSGTEPVIAYRGDGSSNNFIGVSTTEDTDSQMLSTYGETVTITFTSIDNPNVTFSGFTMLQTGNSDDIEQVIINDTPAVAGINDMITGINLIQAPYNTPTTLIVKSAPNTSGGVSTFDIAQLGLRFSSGNGLDIKIGGRAVDTGDRNYISMFGDAGSNSTTGTVTDNVGGETFTATFTLSVNSTSGTNPVIAYRGDTTSYNFIGVSTTEHASSEMSSTYGETVTIAFTSIDNPNVTFSGFTMLQTGMTDDVERAIINDNPAVAGLNNLITGIDLTLAPYNTPTTLKVESAVMSDGGNSSFDIAQLGLRFTVANGATPALALEVFKEDNILNWTVENEIGVKEYQIVDASGALIDTVQAGEGSYSYELTSQSAVKLVVVDHSGYTQTFLPADGNELKVVYNLAEGWNLIAMPGDNADTSELEAATTGNFWAWNGIAYETVEVPVACQGIWVYAPKAVQTIVSYEKCNAEIILESGWNLVGPKENIKVPEVAHTVYSWNDTYQNIATEDALLIQGVGYWIFSL